MVKQAFGLKYSLNIPVYEAETIIQNIKKTYPDFFKWNEGVCLGATNRGYFKTKYGWRWWIPKIYKPEHFKKLVDAKSWFGNLKKGHDCC